MLPSFLPSLHLFILDTSLLSNFHQTAMNEYRERIVTIQGLLENEKDVVTNEFIDLQHFLQEKKHSMRAP